MDSGHKALSKHGSRTAMSNTRRDSSHMLNSKAASIAASAAADGRKQPQRFVCWPEWSDADINAEKWDVAHKGKEKEKGKSPVVQHFFDDPDGKVELPPSLKASHWKRPQDFITEKTPVIVDNDGLSRFDLLRPNEAVHESELARWVSSQVAALWKLNAVPLPPEGVEAGVPTDGEFAYMWRPWEQIYAINKVGKGPNMPAYNPHGKYVVKLYWMGCWRKLVIDDTIPFDEDDNMLLPRTSLQQELWPMLLTKALIKVASLDYSGGPGACEFGDFSVIHCLTGWLPETIPLHAIYKDIEAALSEPIPKTAEFGEFEGYGHLNQVWHLLKSALPEWKLPELPPDKSGEAEEKQPGTADPADKDARDRVSEKADTKSKDGRTEGSKVAKEKDKGKDGKEDKKGKDGKDKDKDRATSRIHRSQRNLHVDHDASDKEKSMISEENAVPEKPEIAVFAAYSGPPKYPVRVSLLGEMADASERLRQSGLSHLYPHPVLVKQTRSCPLEPPPPPEQIPKWKLIRPRKKKTTPSDEPKVEEKEKPIQCVQLTSPFINYKVSTVPIPTDTHRPKSSLERGSTRCPSAVLAIEETDENLPEPDLPGMEDEGKTVTEETAKDQDSNKVEYKSDKKLHVGFSEEVINEGSEAPRIKSGSSKGDQKKKSSAGTARKEDKTPESEKRALTPKEKRKPSASSSRPDSKSTTGKPDKDSKSNVAGSDAQGTPAPVDPNASLPPGEDGEAVPQEAENTPSIEVNLAPIKNEEIWMDFEDFCKCFKTLYIFHKPQTYSCNFKHSDLKTTTPASKDKKSAPNTAASSVYDERSPHYMFVDNLKPTEIVVSFSAVSHWNEPPSPSKEESKTNLKSKDRDRDSRAENLTAESSSVVDGGVGSESSPTVVEPLQPGLLVAEPYSWKSLVTGQPILRLRSTATRAAVLSLPEGRHVLRFHMQAPLGYHVHLCSTTQFVFGDEEKVMAELVKESCRFVDNANQVMTLLGKCLHAFTDVTFKQAYEDFVSAHCPYREDPNMSKQHHFTVFNDALYQSVRRPLADASLASPEMALVWRAFHFDCTSSNILGLPLGLSRPATGVTSDRGSAKGKAAKRHGTNDTGDQPETKVDWSNREITPDEHVAAVKIQKVWRGYWVRKIKSMRTTGSEENLRAQELLLKAWTAMEPNAEAISLNVFRTLFKSDPDLMPHYPFYKDEWNKISFADYAGSHPDQPPNTWFVVFREVFMVSEEMLCVPKLYVPIPTCMLRVVNNDTGEEIPRVFQKVAPYVYKKNKRGYTFVAEARTLDQPLMSGRWRMRLIGALSPLPAPVRNEVNSSFHNREIRDYYIPYESNIVLRYAVKVTEDHLVSLQLSTSKPDVYIKLQVLNQEREVLSAIGKGHVVLPAFLFLKDAASEESSSEKRASSRSSNKGGKLGQSSSKQELKQEMSKTKRVGSASQDGRASSSTHHSGSSQDNAEDDNMEEKPHKYIIQALVLRQSWPLSESSWHFVQMLKEMEKNELKVSFKERAQSPPRSEKMASAAANKAKGKDKGKGAKEKDKGSRPPSQQFDFTKPNWTLRIISDGTAMEEIDVRKDTERADEIRALKKAWEDAEPGRAAKALQSRLAYLKTHMVPTQAGTVVEDPLTIAEEESVTDEKSADPADGATSPGPYIEVEEGVLSLEPPPPPPPKEVLQPLDVSPFLRSSGRGPCIKDDLEEAKQLAERQAVIAAYRSHRGEVEARRERDRQARNQAKIAQLELCEQMQAALDNARASVNAPREAFRQKFLEAERQRLEEIASQEAARAAELEAPSPKGRKSAKGKKSPSGKKKK